MATVIKAVYENGVFKPEEPVSLEEKTRVDLVVQPEVRPADDDPTGWKAAEEIIGIIKDAPSDMAEHHDFYLYGRPRR
jgi:predicted DNA-binding antitoxin AbrB/MazE fold protein